MIARRADDNVIMVERELQACVCPINKAFECNVRPGFRLRVDAAYAVKIEGSLVREQYAWLQPLRDERRMKRRKLRSCFLQPTPQELGAANGPEVGCLFFVSSCYFAQLVGHDLDTHKSCDPPFVDVQGIEWIYELFDGVRGHSGITGRSLWLVRSIRRTVA